MSGLPVRAKPDPGSMALCRWVASLVFSGRVLGIAEDSHRMPGMAVVQAPLPRFS